MFVIYYRYYKEHIYKWAQYLTNIALIMYIIENTSLVTLSFWSSDENYGMYELMGTWISHVRRMINIQYHVFLCSISQNVFHNVFDNVIYTHVLGVLYYEELPKYYKRMVRNYFFEMETKINDAECDIYISSVLLLL